jgi:hypothetical protein
MFLCRRGRRGRKRKEGDGILGLAAFCTFQIISHNLRVRSKHFSCSISKNSVGKNLSWHLI